MAGETAVDVLLPKIQLQSVHGHEARDVDPAPEVAARIAALAGPPIARAPVSAGRCKVLHEEACIYGDEDTGAKPTQESQYLTGTIGVFK